MTSNTIDFDKLVAILQNKKTKGQNEYHFRPYLIDGVYCYIVLYFKFSILTVESVNVKCKFSYQGSDYTQPYELYFRKYKSIQEALILIQKITTKYKILNGDLESPENYAELKLEECVLPYTEDERCSVCFENTTDTTVCDHSICMNCREKCILKQHTNCPICRKEDIIQYYNNKLQLFNNRDSYELKCIFIHNTHKYTFSRVSGEDNEEDDDDDDEDEEDDEDVEEEEDEEPEPDQNNPVIIIDLIL